MTLLNRLTRKLWWLPFGRVAEIDAGELSERLKAQPPVQIVDVRTRAEWRRSHIKGAVSVPLHELKRSTPSLQLDPGRPVVAICLSAHRSIPAVRLLQSRGFPHAVQLRGGMLAWWRRELPTQSGGESV